MYLLQSWDLELVLQCRSINNKCFKYAFSWEHTQQKSRTGLKSV
jgi:hypothetical protein